MNCGILSSYIYRDKTIKERWYVERFHLARSICGNAPDRIASEEFLDYMDGRSDYLKSRRVRIE